MLLPHYLTHSPLYRALFVRALSVTLPRLPHSCNIPLSHSDLTTTSTSPSRHIPDEVYLSLQLCLFYWRYKELALARVNAIITLGLITFPDPNMYHIPIPLFRIIYSKSWFRLHSIIPQLQQSSFSPASCLPFVAELVALYKTQFLHFLLTQTINLILFV